MSDALQRLYQAVLEARANDPAVSRTAKLWQAGRSRMARKIAEEAIEVALDAMTSDRQDVVLESADLIYNLVVLWAEMDITPHDVWSEIERREQLFGIAEKLPKPGKVKTDAPANDQPPK